MQFVLTQEDIKLWSSNFFGMEMTVEYAHDNLACIQLTVPATGLRKLLLSVYLSQKISLWIEKCEPSGITVLAMRDGVVNEDFLRMFVGYVNNYLENVLLEQLPFGRIKIHLEEIWEHIELQSARFDKNCLVIDYAENTDICEELRMLQMLMRAEYKHVRFKPTESTPADYWFADEISDYTLVMADHPADIRMSSHIRVPDWMDMNEAMRQEVLPEETPNWRVTYHCGYIIISIPVTIAEPLIDASTIERNCKRLQGLITDILYGILSYERPLDLHRFSEEELMEMLGPIEIPSPESRRVNSAIFTRHMDEEREIAPEPPSDAPF